ncbi:MAG: hypothetical protein SFU25_08375 [Candidatus Caenarcaniphilales bacterium]|nr:hypothetical protein [Candidatus Caenarcaniphilales bacterium]
MGNNLSVQAVRREPQVLNSGFGRRAIAIALTAATQHPALPTYFLKERPATAAQSRTEEVRPLKGAVTDTLGIYNAAGQPGSEAKQLFEIPQPTQIAQLRLSDLAVGARIRLGNSGELKIGAVFNQGDYRYYRVGESFYTYNNGYFIPCESYVYRGQRYFRNPDYSRQTIVIIQQPQTIYSQPGNSLSIYEQVLGRIRSSNLSSDCSLNVVFLRNFSQQGAPITGFYYNQNNHSRHGGCDVNFGGLTANDITNGGQRDFYPGFDGSDYNSAFPGSGQVRLFDANWNGVSGQPANSFSSRGTYSIR